MYHINQKFVSFKQIFNIILFHCAKTIIVTNFSYLYMKCQLHIMLLHRLIMMHVLIRILLIIFSLHMVFSFYIFKEYHFHKFLNKC